MKILTVSEMNPGWRWLEHRYASRPELDWQLVSSQTTSVAAWMPRRLLWQRLGAALATRGHLSAAADAVLVSFGPQVSALAELTSRSRRRLHLAHGFNYSRLPTGLRRRAQSLAFRSIDRFVVFSNMERSLYANHLDLDPGRIDMIHWGVRPATGAIGEAPLVSGNYVCALGGQGRDYACLVRAMRKLPAVRLVVVATPESMRDVGDLPRNVEVRMNIPGRDAQNILAHSRFMALPLAGSEVPCGHVTLVSAMHFGKAVVVTASSGISDYVSDGVNGRCVRPHDPGEFASAIDELMQSPASCDALGAAGHRFANEHCIEDKVVEHFENVLAELSTGACIGR